MADGVTIPATGSGTATPVVATDDCGAAGHAQVVKLAIATDGSATPVPCDATAGLLVDPSDDALRDNGKVDIAALDQYTPVSGRLPVDGSGVTLTVASHAVTNAGTFAAQAAQSGTWTVQPGNTQNTTPWAVSGLVAHDGANVAANNPAVAGAEAIAHGTNPTAIAAGDVTKTYATRQGIPFVHNGHPNAKTAVYNTTGAQTDDGVTAAIGSGTKYVVLSYGFRLSSAVTVSVSALLGFGATTLPALGASGAEAVEGLIDYHPGMVAGGGINETDCYIPGGDGEEVRLTCSVPTGGTLAVKIRYITIES